MNFGIFALKCMVQGLNCTEILTICMVHCSFSTLTHCFCMSFQTVAGPGQWDRHMCSPGVSDQVDTVCYSHEPHHRGVSRELKVRYTAIIIKRV